jgi:hypothetical protein
MEQTWRWPLSFITIMSEQVIPVVDVTDVKL